MPRYFKASTECALREAIVRIADISTENEKILRVDVYAEGQIRVSGTGNTDQPSYRGQFQTNEVRLDCYDRAGPRTEKEPPWGLAIIRRSGLVAPKPALGANARARGASAPVQIPGATPAPGLLPSAANVSATALTVATQANLPNPQPLPEEGAPASAVAEPPAVSQPKRDSMIECAQYTGSPASGTSAATNAPSDSQLQQAQARSTQVQGGEPQRPEIDLPPIEGTPGVQVPNLSPNPEDLPPNIEPLPDADGSISVPPLPRSGPPQGGSAAPARARNSRSCPSVREPSERPHYFPVAVGSSRSCNCRPRLTVSSLTSVAVASIS